MGWLAGLLLVSQLAAEGRDTFPDPFDTLTVNEPGPYSALLLAVHTPFPQEYRFAFALDKVRYVELSVLRSDGSIADVLYRGATQSGSLLYSMEHFGSGVYFLRLEEEGWSIGVKRFVVE